jgi:hypothetical protein
LAKGTRDKPPGAKAPRASAARATGAGSEPVAAGRARLISPAVRLAPLKLPPPQPLLKVESERELLLMARTLAPRVAENPEFSVLLLANPVLALKAYGIELSPALADHVLRSLRHPRATRERRAALEASLEKELGEVPRPTDPAWLARLVFERRKLTPKDVNGLSPVYGAELFDSAIKRLDARRPAPTSRYPGVRRLQGSMGLKVAPVRPALRRLDLKAPVPPTKPARSAPKALSLEEAWFYKDDPVVAEALELGQIARRALPFRTPDEFRKLQSGEMVDVFRAFVREVKVKGAKAPPPPPPKTRA